MLLVIDSATAACSVALLGADGDVLDEAHEVVNRGHAERLLPMIEAVLAGRRPAAILVDCGPGSFTGVRVGLAAAHGLAIGWGVPVAGYSSLALIAAASGEAAVAVALPGGHGELFVQVYGGDPIAAPRRAAFAHAGRRRGGLRRALGARFRRPGAGRGARPWRMATTPCPGPPTPGRCPPALRSLPPSPIYGRSPDAKPMR